jgi:hypothetical protein
MNIRDLYRGINEFKAGVQPRSSSVKDKNGDLFADSHNFLNRWKNYFSKLLNVHNFSVVRQIEILTAEPLVRGPSSFEVRNTIAKMKKNKLPGGDQVPAKLFQVGCEM